LFSNLQTAEVLTVHALLDDSSVCTYFIVRFLVLDVGPVDGHWAPGDGHKIALVLVGPASVARRLYSHAVNADAAAASDA